MNISLNWLASHLDLSGKSVKEIDDLLTFAGVEVEEIVAKGISSEKIVVAQIVEATQHPNADRLKVTKVDAGEGTLRQIVCGAKNYKVGDKVPCALPGAELPGGFTINETRMRGVDSRGMLCAASEIGLPPGEDGLLILPDNAEIGQPVKQLFDSDVLLEVEVTPNRPDLLSHRGMARELAALLQTPLFKLDIPRRAAVSAGDAVRIEAIAACPFYSAVRVTGVKVQESPSWLRQRLESIGLRPINNIVDITNFVLHELGQPLHAFDAAKVSETIVIREACEGECFIALDDSEHSLTSEDLLVSDSSGAALALAGIMGGAASGVTESTTEIILESAYFTPTNIRRTSRRTALSSDSSYRFERGVDPQCVLAASDLAVKLILELAGGAADEATRTAGETPAPPPPVALDAKKLDQLMGGSISLTDAGEILIRLGLVQRTDGTWEIPSFRSDLRRHIDLVEEIARVHGLEKIPARFLGEFVPASAVDCAYDADMVLRHRLAAHGLYECQTIKLISDAQLRDALPLRPLQIGDSIRVKLPLSEDHAVMRPSIVPGLIASAARNVRQQAKALRFFEMGRVFRNAGGGKARDQEAETLAILLGGQTTPVGWAATDRVADLYDLKGMLAALLPGREIRFLPKERSGFVLGCEIKANDQNIGVFARLEPARERELDFSSPVFVAELDLAKLRKLLAGTDHVEDLAQFPGSTRDAAMDAPSNLLNAKIEEVIAKCAEPLLVSAECFDVFTDPTGVKLAADRKSLAYRFHYRNSSRTLKAEEVDAAHGKLLTTLASTLDVKFR
jgi:phenylalanyl-tRNA synthetase beta chain